MSEPARVICGANGDETFAEVHCSCIAFDFYMQCSCSAITASVVAASFFVFGQDDSLPQVKQFI